MGDKEVHIDWGRKQASKSMRGAFGARSICEVLREINDLAQKDTIVHSEIRKKLYEAQRMAKSMASKLGSYNQKWDKGWWEANPEYKKDYERRLKKDYLAYEKGEKDE